MQNDSKLSARLDAIEKKLDAMLFSTQDSKSEISQTEFMRFYNIVTKEVPKQSMFIPNIIWISNKFSRSLQHNVLYPDYTSGYWFVIGLNDGLPIAFREQSTDYEISFSAVGDFDILEKLQNLYNGGK